MAPRRAVMRTSASLQLIETSLIDALWFFGLLHLMARLTHFRTGPRLGAPNVGEETGRLRPGRVRARTASARLRESHR